MNVMELVANENNGGRIVNLNQVTIPVKNMKEATDFYRELGFILIVDTPHYARFECPEGTSTFSLSLTVDKFRNGAIMYFEHENLDGWVRRLLAKGVEFEMMPVDQPFLWREAALSDPSGNKIKLYWAGENRLNPPWRVEGKKG
jgi:catechol 2,3-dioxygenase-like lactoylglutathione lyase family enzyme